MPVSLDDSDIVRVVNKGDAPYTIMYDSKPYKLMPGEDAFIPFSAACVWFGDPRSTGTIGSVQNERGIRSYIPDRETEVRRLRAKYDNQFGDETTIIRHPQVEVYAITGERVTTVLDDPSGETVNVVTQTASDQSNLMSLIQAQQAQIEQLTQLVMTTQNTGGSGEAQQGSDAQPPTADELTAALAGGNTEEPVAIEQLGGEAATEPETEPEPSNEPSDSFPPDASTSDQLPPQSQP